MATLWGGNLIINGEADSTTTGWTASGLTAIDGGTSGLKGFQLASNGYMYQEILPQKTNPQTENIQFYADVRVNELKTLSDVYITLTVFYSDGSFDDYVFPCNNAIYDEVSGFVGASQSYWARVNEILKIELEKTVTKYKIEFRNKSTNLAFIDDIELVEDQGIPVQEDTGPITGDDIPPDSISTTHLQDLSITTAKIALAAITDALIANATITTAKIGDAQITNAKIANAAINNAKIENGSITSAKIGDAEITTAKIAVGAITTALLGNAAVGTAQIADGSITDAKIVTLTANKLTAGTIDGSRINVTNLVADNIVAGTLTFASANLLRNSGWKDGTSNWSINAAVIRDTTFKYDTSNTLKWDRSGLVADNIAIADSDKIDITPGQTVTATVYSYTDDLTTFDDSPNKTNFYIDFVDANNVRTGVAGTGIAVGILPSAAGVWQRFKATGVAPAGTVKAYVRLYTFRNGRLWVARPMLQKGKIASEWQPHTNELLADKGITNLQIGDSAVDNRVITANTITGDRLVIDTITAREIASKTITANEIVTGTITAASGIIADLAITTAKIADAAITGAKIQNAQIVDAHISGTLSANKVRIGVGTMFDPGYDPAAANATAADAMTAAEAAQGVANQAQTDANTAISNAATAQQAAADAQQDATDSLEELGFYSRDDKLTPLEKLRVKSEMNKIETEYPTIIAQANKYSIATTSYTTEYNDLKGYIDPLIATIPGYAAIVRTTFTAYFTDYYNARESLLKAITDKAKDIADAAQGAANTAQSTANAANSTANGTKSQIDLWKYPNTTLIDGGDIYTGSITANQINVSNLSALSSNLGTVTAGSLTSNTTINVATNLQVGREINIGNTTGLSDGLKILRFNNTSNIHSEAGTSNLGVSSPYFIVSGGDMHINSNLFVNGSHNIVAKFG